MLRHVLLSLALIAAPALAADGITTSDPVAFRAQMAEMGYAPGVPDVATDGTTVTFILHLEDETLAAVLAGCSAGKNCAHIVLAGSFSNVSAPAAWVAERNAEYDLIKVWLRKDGKVAYGIGVPIEGMPRETFRRWIQAIAEATDDLGQEAIKAGYGPKK